MCASAPKEVSQVGILGTSGVLSDPEQSGRANIHGMKCIEDGLEYPHLEGVWSLK